MTTIIDPSGTPTVIFNKSGTTITTITPTGTNAASAAPIIRSSEYTIVIVPSNGSGGGLLLPTDAEIGDVIEMHVIHIVGSPSFGGINLYAGTGQTVDDSSSGGGTHSVVRYIASGKWSSVGATAS